MLPKPRSRTFTGCRTCRSRHLKCDETKPICTSCQRLNLPCEGYTPSLLWVISQESSAEEKRAHRGSSYRYPLFSEEERERMSGEMVRSLGGRSAEGVAEELDGEEEEERRRSNEEVKVERFEGPFGVFRVKTRTSGIRRQGSQWARRGVADNPASIAAPSLSSPQISPNLEVLTAPASTSILTEPSSGLMSSLTASHHLHNHHLMGPPSSQRHNVPGDRNSLTNSNTHPTLPTWPGITQASLFADVTGGQWYPTADEESSLLAALDGLEELWLNTGGTGLTPLASDSAFSFLSNNNNNNMNEEHRSAEQLTGRDGDVVETPESSGTEASEISERQSTKLVSAPRSSPPIASSALSSVTRQSPNLLQTIPPTPSPPPSSVLPPHAASLIRYYRSHVDQPCPSSLGARVSPWQVMLLPCSLETFAELSLWNTTSHVRRSILSTLLGRSAYHLHKSCRGDAGTAQFWLDVGRRHQKEAQTQLKLALRKEFAEVTPVGYNEILLAVLATAMGSVYYHGPKTLTLFLLDAERVIRLRGLSLPKSFKLRLLHHMYTHLRIMFESVTIPLPVTSSSSSSSSSPQISPPPVFSSSPSSAQVPTNSGALRKFRISENALCHDLDLQKVKPPDIGYTDIHLNVSGLWPATLYPDMYGIPESLMTLLSQTISLANEKSRLDTLATTDSAVSDRLARHVKRLEQNIWSWSLAPAEIFVTCPSIPAGLVSGPVKLVQLPTTQLLIRAMHQALIIYFYRRIYNMSAMVVQDAVKRALAYVEKCLEMAGEEQDFRTSICWVCFVAGCEAVGEEAKRGWEGVLGRLDDWGGFFGEKRVGAMAREVWGVRERTGDLTYSWMSIVGDGGVVAVSG